MLRDASQRPRSHYIFNLRCNYLWIIQVAIWNLIKHRVLRRIRIVDVSLSLHPLHSCASRPFAPATWPAREEWRGQLHELHLDSDSFVINWNSPVVLQFRTSFVLVPCAFESSARGSRFALMVQHWYSRLARRLLPNDVLSVAPQWNFGAVAHFSCNAHTHLNAVCIRCSSQRVVCARDHIIGVSHRIHQFEIFGALSSARFARRVSARHTWCTEHSNNNSHKIVWGKRTMEEEIMR